MDIQTYFRLVMGDIADLAHAAIKVNEEMFKTTSGRILTHLSLLQIEIEKQEEIFKEIQDIVRPQYNAGNNLTPEYKIYIMIKERHGWE